MTPTQALPYQPRPSARQNYLDYDHEDYGEYSDDYSDFDGHEEPHREEYHDVHHVHHIGDDEEHPVYVTSTDPHTYFSHHDDEFIVADGNDYDGYNFDYADAGETIGSLFGSDFGGHSFFLDSKNDLDAARESNKYLQ